MQPTARGSGNRLSSTAASLRTSLSACVVAMPHNVSMLAGVSMRAHPEMASDR